MDFSQLTIVIITKNRSNFLIRNINWWAPTGVKIIIMDGSDTPISSEIINKFLPNIKYLNSPKSIEERLVIASSFVTTKYVIQSGDDDLFLHSGVDACIKELESNLYLVACIGLPLGFIYLDNALYGKLVYENVSEYGQIIDSKASLRVRSHLKNYECTCFYGVIRTNIWKTNVSIIESKESLPGNLSEIFFELSTVYQGKTKVINYLMWLRSFENTSQWSQQYPSTDWFFKINNPIRKEIFTRLRCYLFSDQKKFQLLKTDLFIKFVIIKFYLKPIAQKYGIPGLFWILFLPPAYFNANFNNSFFCYIKSCSKYILNKLQKYSLSIGNSFNNSCNVSKKVQSKKLLKDYISEKFSLYNQNEIDDLIFQISNFYTVD